MTISINRIKAILIKELKDLKSNTNCLVMILLPIMFSVIYGQIITGMPKIQALILPILMAIILIGPFIPSMLIAEEKEKNTLRVLMLSPAKAPEVMIGKGLLSLILLIIESILCVIIPGCSFGNILIFLSAILLMSIFMIILGMTVGLVSPDSKATGVIGFPIYIIFFIPIVFIGVKNELLDKFAHLIPTFHLGEILNKNMNSKSFGVMQNDFLNMIIWLVLAIILFVVVYKKKSLEDN